MLLSNPFKEETRNIFLYQNYCMSCGSNQGIELHHICGRSSSSPLNAIVLCLKCHAHCGHSLEEESKYAQITITFLLKERYNLSKEDIDFYKDNYKLYGV